MGFKRTSLTEVCGVCMRQPPGEVTEYQINSLHCAVTAETEGSSSVSSWLFSPRSVLTRGCKHHVLFCYSWRGDLHNWPRSTPKGISLRVDCTFILHRLIFASWRSDSTNRGDCR
ncbi:hypothetical protein CY34DRAFT_185151 [Suillus luteus UH-Slu-Lm8-n1]|uniref:Uncharacterized protein n=1 Tax=Suillus luteus UH-Slu-Lm8-n1 TaxID=930992 RepID=A0A0C9ZVA2_9AGAM|nr:hypothetical protein CY34DRAFT_185151 [Suillus luteus UH-Slu-Lm8-n1]